ncbi:F-box/LRR-repeat protein 2 isoform X3 [Phycodurus eques]|uniref:F-box/LRR-repeat protein 2 isoform X3 n=1 Tax=Phycodurus eques TaxID=693459 RepID=UPI002ACEBC85|nr:F-box/LRR-repeat protein 2 isoform X3 [Phycodurus eques]
MEGCDEEDSLEVPELPLEIVVYILSFLRTSDRKEASLVCRSWYIASQDLCFQKNAIFSFPASASSLELVRSLGRRSRCSLIISQLDGFSLSRSLLLEVGLRVGSKLDSLALPGSSVTEASLLALLPRLTSLRRLDLRGLDSLFMSGAFLSRKEHRQQVKSALSSLEELDLSDLRYLSDLTFNRLTSCTPRLRRLSLAGCHIAFEFDPYRGCPVGTVEVSSALLSLRNLRKLLTEQSATLVALDLSRTAIAPESLRSIAQVEGVSLEELCLQSCKELTDYSVEVLVKHQPGLRKLDISGCAELTGRAVVAVARSLSSLTHLSLSRDWKVTETGLADLVSVASLRGLDLSECLHVGGAEMVKGLSQCRGERAQLEKLNLRSCTYMRSSTVAPAVSYGDGFIVCVLHAQVVRFTDLQHLSLSSLPGITDASLSAVARHCRALAGLELSHCARISDRGVAQAAPHLHRLQHLYLSGCNSITDKSLFLLAQHCKRLKTLDVSKCGNISGTAMERLPSQLPFLENVQYKLPGGTDFSTLI